LRPCLWSDLRPLAGAPPRLAQHPELRRSVGLVPSLAGPGVAASALRRYVLRSFIVIEAFGGAQAKAHPFFVPARLLVHTLAEGRSERPLSLAGGFVQYARHGLQRFALALSVRLRTKGASAPLQCEALRVLIRITKSHAPHWSCVGGWPRPWLIKPRRLGAR